MRYKNILGKLLESGLVEKWGFILIFFIRVIYFIILGHFLKQSETIDHYYYALEKYTFLIVFAYLGIKTLYLLFHDRKALLKGGTIFLFLFCCVVVASTFINDPDFMYDYMKKLSVSEMLMVSLFFYNIPRFITKTDFHTILLWCGRLMCYTVLALGVLSLYIYFTGNSVSLFGTVFKKAEMFTSRAGEIRELRYHGLFNYPTTLGFRCYLASVLALYLNKQKKMNAITTIFIIIMSFILIYLANARTGLLNMLVIMAFVLIEILKKAGMNTKKAYKVVGIMILVIVVTVCIWKRELIIQLINDPTGALNTFTSLRVELFLDRIKVFMAHPWIGAGWAVKTFGSEFGATNAHNIIANILAWTGIAGFASFSGFVICSIVNMVKNKQLIDENPYLLCLVICVTIHSLLDQAIIGDMRNPATYMFWICIGFLAYGPRTIVNRSDV